MRFMSLPTSISKQGLATSVLHKPRTCGETFNWYHYFHPSQGTLVSGELSLPNALNCNYDPVNREIRESTPNQDGFGCNVSHRKFVEADVRIWYESAMEVLEGTRTCGGAEVESRVYRRGEF